MARVNVPLYPHQKEALSRIHNGSIVYGDVGTGKSRTSIAYYVSQDLSCDIYVITTAKKRDSKEWDNEFEPFGITNYTVDSWNNIGKYVKVSKAFFIFDEQRVVGKGSWVKSFLKITRQNLWILLTATPGDTWSDYIPVFIANGFYRNRTEFNNWHIVYKPYMKYPVIDHYVNTGILVKHRKEVLVRLEFQKTAQQIKHRVVVDYSKDLYKKVFKDRWDPYKGAPIEEVASLCYLLRKVVNSDPSRIDAVKNLLLEHEKTIIFYNFSYELSILRRIAHDLHYDIGEWNGEVHSDVPSSDKWVYLVQYRAGSEGWNCVTTNTIIFYSQSYSYKTTVQAAGRIDRLNTPFDELHYFYIRSAAPIDLAISAALRRKQTFNEKDYIGGK